ncbi:hypothetical protein Dimus_003138 [Dionaea muscipula]
MAASSSLMLTRKRFFSNRSLFQSPPFTHIKTYPSIPSGRHCCYRHHANHSTISSFLSRSRQRHQSQAPRAHSFSSPFSSSSSSSSSTLAGQRLHRVGFISWYLGMLKSRPVLTKSFTCSLIYTVSDLSSQTLSLPSSSPYDYVRMSRMAGYGLLILGPTMHLWFNFMSKIVPGRDLLTTVKKMVLGQTVYGPIMTVVFFSVNSALQGEDGREIIARLKRDLLPTLLNGAMYWPLCDFITYKFIPVHLQPLVSNSFSFVWTVYMTYMASLAKASPE